MKRLFPEWHARERTAFAVLIAAPHVVDEDIQPAGIGTNAMEERLGLAIDGVIAPDGYSMAATVRHQPGGLVDRARHVVRGAFAIDTAAGDVHGCSGGAQLEGDPATGSAAGP